MRITLGHKIEDKRATSISALGLREVKNSIIVVISRSAPSGTKERIWIGGQLLIICTKKEGNKFFCEIFFVVCSYATYTNS